ncbi:MAG: helix-turn-helix transcriptional regulator [Phycisphaerae bacterium]|jgi:transcriptional regulator with XRE-family HTH domain
MPSKKTDTRVIAIKGAIGREQGAHDLSETATAERMNVSRETLSNWKKNPGSMSLAHFWIMAKALHFSDEEILNSIK